MMTAAERVEAAASFQEADRVPVAPLLCGATRRVKGVSYAEWSQDGELAARCQLDAQEMIGFDGMSPFLDLSVEAADFGQEMVYPLEDTAHPNYDNPLIATPDDYLKIKRVDPTAGGRMAEILKGCDVLMNERGATVPVMGFVYGPLGVLGMMRGAEKLFVDCMKHRELVLEAMEQVTLTLIDFVKAQAATGVGSITIDTLFASETIMSEKLWEETEAPFAKRITDAIREAGIGVNVHNCGKGPYMDVQLKWMGEPFLLSHAYIPHECETMAEAKEKYWGRVVFAGNVDPPKYLFMGTPEEVRQECKRQLEEMSQGGGYILAAGCEYPPNGNLLNAVAMMEAAELYNPYQ